MATVNILYRFAFRKEESPTWTYYRIRKVSNGFIIEGDTTFPTPGNLGAIARNINDVANRIADMLDFTG